VSYSVSGDTFVPGAIRRFGGNLTPLISGATRVYSFAPQGDRSAAVMAPDEGAGTPSRPNYVVVLNFFEEIKRQAAQAATK
jgi:hypothetical protein